MFNRKSLKVAIILVVSFPFILFWLNVINNLDIETVISNGVNIKVSVNQLYKSEQGFGDDSFEVYSIEMEEPSELENFQKINEEYFEKVHRFKSMISAEAWNGELSDVKKEEILAAIASVEDSADSRFLYTENEERLKYEINIYNQKLNKGYYMLLKL